MCGFVVGARQLGLLELLGTVGDGTGTLLNLVETLLLVGALGDRPCVLLVHPANRTSGETSATSQYLLTIRQ
jgi:hypothetical protein